MLSTLGSVSSILVYGTERHLVADWTHVRWWGADSHSWAMSVPHYCPELGERKKGTFQAEDEVRGRLSLASEPQGKLLVSPEERAGVSLLP